MATPEGLIQTAICEYLALKKYFFFRNNNTPTYDSVRKAYRAMGKFTMKGLPDIIVVKNGSFIGLEVKQKGGKLSSSQKEVCVALRANKAVYEVVTSVDDVIKLGL